VRAKIAMLAHLYRVLGGRHIDNDVNNSRADLPIYRAAKREGVRL